MANCRQGFCAAFTSVHFLGLHLRRRRPPLCARWIGFIFAGRQDLPVIRGSVVAWARYPAAGTPIEKKCPKIASERACQAISVRLPGLTILGFEAHEVVGD